MLPCCDHCAYQQSFLAGASLCAHLDSAFILSVWLVYVYVSCRTCRKLAGAFVYRDCLKLEFLVDVDGLEDVIGSVKDNERVSGDVDLYEK